MSQKTYLTELELFKRWEEKVSLKTLRNWRAGKTNTGPTFVKFGQRVLYPVTGVEEYENRATVSNHMEASA